MATGFVSEYLQLIQHLSETDSRRVGIGMCDTFDDVLQCSDFFHLSDCDVYLCILPDSAGLSAGDVDDFVRATNQYIVGDDMWFVGYHPESDATLPGLRQPVVLIEQLSKTG